MRSTKLPSPALVVALLALFVSLGGTAVAASPIVQRALFANNAGKLQGKTAAQVAALPGPASTAAALVSTKAAADALGPQATKDITIACDAGAKVLSGGFSSSGPVLAFDSRPVNETTWGIFAANLSSSAAAELTVHAVCVR